MVHSFSRARHSFFLACALAALALCRADTSGGDSFEADGLIGSADGRQLLQTCPTVSSVLTTLTGLGLNSLAAALNASSSTVALLNSVQAANSGTLQTLTVFAPTDLAFAALLGALPGSPTLATLAASPDALALVLKYHVFAAYYPSTALPVGPVTTAAGGNLTISATGLNVTGAFNSARITTANAVNIASCSIAVHVIDTVLLPVSVPAAISAFGLCPTVTQVLSVLGSANLTTLVTALSASAPTVSTLTNYQTANSGSLSRLTVFAPTNAAFAALLASLPNNPTLAVLANSSATLAAVLGYHAFTAYYPATALPVGPVATLAGSNVTISAAGLNVTGGFNSAKIVGANAYNNAGCSIAVHVIDTVLLPVSVPAAITAFGLCPTVNSVLGVLTGAGLTTLVAALSASATTVSTLNSYQGTTGGSLRQLTLFAPSNDAFTRLLAALPGSSLNALASSQAALALVLGFHAITSYYPSTALPTGAVTTVAGANYNLTVSGGNVTGAFNTVRILTPNAYNNPGCGIVVHVIDNVLLPVSVATAMIAFGLTSPPPPVASPPPKANAAVGTRSSLSSMVPAAVLAVTALGLAR